MKKYITIFILAIIVGFNSGHYAVAQDDATVTEPELRSRITYANGDVVVQPSVSGNTLEAVINMPLMTGDRLACGADGAMEFRLDEGVNGWMWYETKIEFIESQATGQVEPQNDVRLWYGAMAIRTIPVGQTDRSVTVDIGSSRIRAGSDSLLRVTVESDQTAVYLTVYKGTAMTESRRGNLTMAQGETWRTMPGSSEWTAVETPAEDEFDAWVMERDRLLSGAYENSGQFAEGVVPGEYVDEAATLHGYGRWVSLSGSWYWSPYVAAGWVPYHHGYWDFYPGCGWMWIPFEPWGWTVYHLGYWSFYNDWGWLWFPSWRWRGHYAHWRYDGRSVHWVAAHPEDDMDGHGLLREGAVPRNSRLAIGIPVEAGQSVDQMLSRTPVVRNAITYSQAENTPWQSKLPDTLRPSNSRRPGLDRVIDETPARVQRYGQPPVRDSRPSGSVQPYRRPVGRSGVTEIQKPYSGRVAPESRRVAPESRRVAPESRVRTTPPPDYNRSNQKSPVNRPGRSPGVNIPSPTGKQVRPPAGKSVKPPVVKPGKIPSKNNVIPDVDTIKKPVSSALKGGGILNLFKKGVAGGAMKNSADALLKGGKAALKAR